MSFYLTCNVLVRTFVVAVVVAAVIYHVLCRLDLSVYPRWGMLLPSWSFKMYIRMKMLSNVSNQCCSIVPLIQ